MFWYVFWFLLGLGIGAGFVKGYYKKELEVKNGKKTKRK